MNYLLSTSCCRHDVALFESHVPNKQASHAGYVTLFTSAITFFIFKTQFRELTDEKHAPVSRMIFNVYK